MQQASCANALCGAFAIAGMGVAVGMAFGLSRRRVFF
jgi:hypothetical protein